MIPRIISKENLNEWLSQLSKEYPLIAPIFSERENDFEYEKVDNIENIAFDFDRTRLSLKQLFLKPEEILFSASLSSGNPTPVKYEEERQVVFAARPCDITALNLLDKVFGQEPYPDPYYLSQRDRTIIIGLRCTKKCRTCFCGTMDSFDPLEGFDLMLTPLPTGNYLVESGTGFGKQILRKYDSLMRKAGSEDRSLVLTTFKAIEASFTPHIPTTGIRVVMELSLNESLWKKYGEICLACGSCVFVCPTCWCFDVKEKVAADPTDPGNVDKTVRYRRWTSCLYREFHSVSGGHVFKPHVSSRLENYYNHKMKGVHEQFGVWGCVGCGRCVSACPVGIDVRESLKEITGV